MDLKKFRERIDSIDSAILALLNKRAKIILEIGKVKARHKHAVYVPDREVEVYKKIMAGNKGPLSDKAVTAIFREIMSGALQLERPINIAYLGPEFTFTHLASMKKFGSSVNYSGCATIRDVFSEVEKERADYGVVPIENSVEGAVNYTLDMFVDSDLKICSEVFLDISHNLMSKEKDKSRIKKVYSVPQVFGQCRLWLEANLPNVDLVEVSSTAKAAEISSKEKGVACIGSRRAGEKYGLNLLYSSIEDSAHNVTRFLVIGRTDAKVTDHDKTSLMLSIKDKVGGLHNILVPFKKHKLNLTKIESRPSRTRAWEYYFFIDVEGHYSEARVAKALEMLKNETTYLKILGSYPIGSNV